MVNRKTHTEWGCIKFPLGVPSSRDCPCWLLGPGSSSSHLTMEAPRWGEEHQEGTVKVNGDFLPARGRSCLQREGESREIVGEMNLGYAGHKALPVQEGISCRQMSCRFCSVVLLPKQRLDRFTRRLVVAASLCNFCGQWSSWGFLTDVEAKITRQGETYNLL